MQKPGFARILFGIAAFDVLDLPAGREIRLAPGGIHLMLAGLKHPLRAGGAVALSLAGVGADGETRRAFEPPGGGRTPWTGGTS